MNKETTIPLYNESHTQILGEVVDIEERDGLTFCTVYITDKELQQQLRKWKYTMKYGTVGLIINYSKEEKDED